jgi:hypothetical protein
VTATTATKRERAFWLALPPAQAAALFFLWEERRVLGRELGARTEAALLRARLVRYPIACPAPRGDVDDRQTMSRRHTSLRVHLEHPRCICAHVELTVDGVRAVLTLYPHLAPRKT